MLRSDKAQETTRTQDIRLVLISQDYQNVKNQIRVNEQHVHQKPDFFVIA